MKFGPEDRIQLAILEYLEIVLPHAVVFHVPNGGRRALYEAQRFKALGVRAGVSDLILLTANGAYFIEVKAGRKKPTPEQEIFMSDARALGFGTAVVRSVDDVRLALEAWGLIRKQGDKSRVLQEQC